MEPDCQWNVFVPQQMWSEPPGYLSGYVDFDYGHVYIHGISDKSPEPHAGKLIGCWQSSCGFLSEKVQTETCWVCIKVDEGKRLCSLFVKGSKGSIEQKPSVCITFNPDEVMESYILNRSNSDSFVKGGKDVGRTSVTKNVIHGLNSKTDSNSAPELEKNLVVKPKRQDLLASLVKMLNRPHGKLSNQKCVKLFNVATRKRSQSHTSFSVPLFLVWIFSFLEQVIKTGLQGIRICSRPLPKILHTPSTFQYLQDKIDRYKLCLRLDKSKNLNIFLLNNCYSQQLLDTCLGVSAIVLVTSYSVHHKAAIHVLDWADGVASQLTDLVQWLMGAPAGLKLNAQLTNFLGHFFIYHIYLWTGYLSLLRSALPSLLWYCSLFGVLGVSAQLCLLRDLLSMLTLHIYCFYVYAAKIFSLQVYTMGSLWRLFRGKKWNVLRSRVDSAVYSTDQLFVGTLFFTILLFLLPTTALYYAVFTFLRLAALTVQGCLAYILDIIMTVPVFTLVLKLFRPKLVAGNVQFTVKQPMPDKECLMLHMQTCQIPLQDLLKITQAFFRPFPKKGLTWMEFVSHLATGKLIYPWVEPQIAGWPQKKVE